MEAVVAQVAAQILRERIAGAHRTAPAEQPRFQRQIIGDAVAQRPVLEIGVDIGACARRVERLGITDHVADHELAAPHAVDDIAAGDRSLQDMADRAQILRIDRAIADARLDRPFAIDHRDFEPNAKLRAVRIRPVDPRIVERQVDLQHRAVALEDAEAALDAGIDAVDIEAACRTGIVGRADQPGIVGHRDALGHRVLLDRGIAIGKIECAAGKAGLEAVRVARQRIGGREARERARQTAQDRLRRRGALVIDQRIEGVERLLAVRAVEAERAGRAIFLQQHLPGRRHDTDRQHRTVLRIAADRRAAANVEHRLHRAEKGILQTDDGRDLAGIEEIGNVFDRVLLEPRRLVEIVELVGDAHADAEGFAQLLIVGDVRRRRRCRGLLGKGAGACAYKSAGGKPPGG